jgi:hypothetical protein
MSVSHSHCTNKKQYHHDSKRMKESARMNRDPYMHHTMIPRTQRIQKEQASLRLEPRAALQGKLYVLDAVVIDATSVELN